MLKSVKNCLIPPSSLAFLHRCNRVMTDYIYPTLKNLL